MLMRERRPRNCRPYLATHDPPRDGLDNHWLFKLEKHRRFSRQGADVCGMKNQGASCYMSVVMHLLAAIPQIPNYLKDSRTRPLGKILALVEALRQGDRVGVDLLTSVVHLSAPSRFSKNSPQDFAEYLHYVLSLIGAKFPYVLEPFQSTMRSVITCGSPSCKNSTVKTDTHLILPLPLGRWLRPAGTPEDTEAVPVHVLLERWASEGTLLPGYKCPKCLAVGGSTNKCYMEKLATCLILNFKRIHMDPRTQQRVRSQTSLACPKIFNFTTYTFPRANSTQPSNIVSWKMTHAGTVLHGKGSMRDDSVDSSSYGVVDGGHFAMVQTDAYGRYVFHNDERVSFENDSFLERHGKKVVCTMYLKGSADYQWLKQERLQNNPSSQLSGKSKSS